MAIETICWKNNRVRLIDQTVLPERLSYLNCDNVSQLVKAIKRLSVRGAPALGVAAGFGVLLASKNFKGKSRKSFDRHVTLAARQIAKSRPTAVNLFTALNRMEKVLKEDSEKTVTQIQVLLKQEALNIFKEDKAACRQMGNYGSKLIKNNAAVLTVCNAGALATVDYGTALGVFYSAKKRKKKFQVYACETRPLLQGARLTTWELKYEKINTTLVCDNMAATLMKQNKIDAVFTGADRIASNGDAANKIGTYNLAVLAKYHNIPFYIVAPESSFDMSLKDGKQIPIEQRNADEVRMIGKKRIAPSNVKVYNPAFDVTGHKLITAIITDKGIIKPPFKLNIKKKIKND